MAVRLTTSQRRRATLSNSMTRGFSKLVRLDRSKNAPRRMMLAVCIFKRTGHDNYEDFASVRRR